VLPFIFRNTYEDGIQLQAFRRTNCACSSELFDALDAAGNAHGQVYKSKMTSSIAAFFILKTQDYYHLKFAQDPLQLKILVYGLFVFEWVQWGAVIEVAFVTFVLNTSNGTTKHSAIIKEWFPCRSCVHSSRSRCNVSSHGASTNYRAHGCWVVASY